MQLEMLLVQGRPALLLKNLHLSVFLHKDICFKIITVLLFIVKICYIQIDIIYSIHPIETYFISPNREFVGHEELLESAVL